MLGTLLCVKHTVPHMVKAGGGSFVGMSSLAGHRTHLYFGAFIEPTLGAEVMAGNLPDGG